MTSWPTGDMRLTFNEVPDLYENVRPSYPADLFDHLFERLPHNPRILEVGPGTGQATQGLVERGAPLTAVEIGPALAAILDSKYQHSDRVRVVNDSSETAPLDGRRFDAGVSATANTTGSRRPIPTRCQESRSSSPTATGSTNARSTACPGIRPTPRSNTVTYSSPTPAPKPCRPTNEPICSTNSSPSPRTSSTAS
ncbi:MAG: methyltransferase domain-containing protein [Actinomycetia bacterium]|nr:methyltransferase domain-containing protein [Actinomycetes bacterium]